MPLVNVTANQRTYTIACDPGEEEHLLKLAAHVDAKLGKLVQSAGQAGEARLLLMAALLIADDYFEGLVQLEKRRTELESLSGERDEADARIMETAQRAAVALDSAAGRIEEVAARLSGA
jgi:cell division protein ZapA